jgi:F-type H+-transporting ATPase subunit epsilon
MATDKQLKIDIVTPQRIIFSEYANAVSVPGSDRPFEVLYNHAPITSSLIGGAIKISLDDSKEIWYATGSGFIEVLDNVVSIVVESAVRSTELSQEMIDAEVKNAQAVLAAAITMQERNDAKKAIETAQAKARLLKK